MAKIALLDDNENILNMIKRKIECESGTDDELIAFNSSNLFLDTNKIVF